MEGDKLSSGLMPVSENDFDSLGLQSASMMQRGHCNLSRGRYVTCL